MAEMRGFGEGPCSQDQHNQSREREHWGTTREGEVQRETPPLPTHTVPPRALGTN